MATMAIERDALVVRLSALEKLAAFRGDVTVPLANVEAIAVDEHPWEALRGIRAPGTGIPRVVAYGVRLLTGGRPDFAALRGHRPAVRVELCAGAPFGRLLVTVPDATATVAAARATLTRAPGA